MGEWGGGGALLEHADCFLSSYICSRLGRHVYLFGFP